MRLPRLNFLARFMLVTFASAAVAALVLAYVLDTALRHTVEADQTRDAIARVDAVFAPLVDRLGRSSVAAEEFARAQRDALVFSYVTGVRLYDDHGRAIAPTDAPSQRDIARRALGREEPFVVDSGESRTAYAGLANRDGTRSYVVAVDLSVPQMMAQSTRGRWIVVGTTGSGVALMFFSLIAFAAYASHELERRRRKAQQSFVEALAVMARTLDLRDPYTAGHSERVAAYSKLIAQEMGLPADEVSTIENGAMLHDIGKIAVPDSVLFKNGMLDAGELDMIRVHPAVGAHIIGTIASMENVVPCILHHHERMDGTGYPHGVAGDKIPLSARIIAVADSFDAMTTDRPYRRGRSTAEALGELQVARGTQFDDRCVAAFARLVARGAIVPPVSRGDTVFARRIEMEVAVRP